MPPWSTATTTSSPTARRSTSIRRASWDYNRYLLAKQFELFTNGEVSKPLQSGLDYELQTEAGIRYKLTSWASLSMKAEWDKFSGNDGNVNQRRYTFGLGVGW